MSLRAEHERKHAAVERQRQELAARRRALAEQHRLQQRQLRVKHKTMAAVESSGVSSLLARRVSQRKRRKQADELQAQHAQQQREHKAAAAREAETLPRASPSTPPPCGTRRRRARPTPRCRVTPRAEEVARLREAHVAEAAGGGGSKRTESRGSRFVSESRGSKRFVTGVSIVKERASVRSGPTSCCARFGCATRGRVEATEEGREGKERVHEGKDAASDWCVRHHAQSRLERQARVTSARRRDYVSARVASCVSAPKQQREHKAAAAREAETLPRASPSTPPPCGTRRRRARPTPRCRVTPRAEEVARLREAHVAEAAGGGGSKRTESRGSRFVSESRGSKRFVTGVSIVKERASVRSGPTSCCARFGCATRGRVEATEEGREGKERVHEGKDAASDWCVRHHAQSRLERQARVTSARRRDYVSARVASCVSAPSASKELRGPIQKLYIGPALHVRNAGSLPRSAPRVSHTALGGWGCAEAPQPDRVPS